MSFATYTIGRASHNDIVIAKSSVSRVHAEITIIESSSRVFVLDRASSLGVFKWEGQTWKKVKQGFWYTNEAVRFGEYETSIEVLIGLIFTKPTLQPTVAYEPISVRPRRNSATGEIED